MKPILVTAYASPDLDGLAGAMAYAEYLQKTGRDANAGFMGELHAEAKYVLDRFSIPYPKKIENADDFNEVILVDASDLNGLDGKVTPEKVIEVIDHRKIHEADKFPNAIVQIELVGAAVTLVAEKFMQSEVEISKESAILLYAGIISNTLNFKAGVTTERDRVAATWLNQFAKLPADFWVELFTAKSDLSGEKLVERIRGDFASFAFGGKKFGIAQIEIIGVEKLIAERKDEIIQVLEAIKKEIQLEFVFQSTLELAEAKNYFVTSDAEAKQLLEKVLGVQFIGDVAVREGLIMRKQIVPLLKEELE
jgi:inorganic pyrophosphatase/exopolyphosphatase